MPHIWCASAAGTMQAAAPAGVGAMAAVIGAEDAMVETVCREVSSDHVVVPANYNSPGQIVIGGHAVAVDAWRLPNWQNAVCAKR